MKKYCFGVDVGGTTVKMGLFQADGVLIDKWKIKTRTENKGEAILSDIGASIQDKMDKHGIVSEDVIKIGVGVPAPVTESGFVKSTANLGWENKNIKQELGAITGFGVRVGNDVNIAALGEMWQGGGLGYKNLVMVTLGTGVGGGIIIDGHIHGGVNGASGEIGHMFVNSEETECCGCGKKGCLEQYASATGVVRLAKRRLENNQTDTVLKAEHVTAKDVFDAVKAGDTVAVEIAEEFGQYLGHALSNIAVLLDPEIFVIGGGISKAGEVLLQYIEKYYTEKAFWANKQAKFALAELGNDAGIYGAAKLALG